MQVSVNGVTGPRPKVNTRVEHLLQDIKLVTDKAVCVGFGISTPDHVRQVNSLLISQIPSECLIWLQFSFFFFQHFRCKI